MTAPADTSPADVDLLTGQLRRVDETRLVSGTLTAANDDVARFALVDGREGILPRSEFYPNRMWRQGGRYVLADVHGGERPLLSTTDPQLISLLLESYSPEIRDGKVQVCAVAREPGIRAKVAVAATEPGVDPVAACLGRASNRIQAISADLGGERVDVVAYSDDPATFTRNALGPIALTSLTIDDDGVHVAIVEPHAAAAAVGGGGLNAKLTAALCGIRLSIRSADSPDVPVRLRDDNEPDTRRDPSETPETSDAALPAEETSP